MSVAALFIIPRLRLAPLVPYTLWIIPALSVSALSSPLASLSLPVRHASDFAANHPKSTSSSAKCGGLSEERANSRINTAVKLTHAANTWVIRFMRRIIFSFAPQNINSIFFPASRASRKATASP